MTSQAILPYKPLVAILFSALMLAHPWAMAADTPSAGRAQAGCIPGNADCPPGSGAADRKQVSARQGRTEECPQDSQDCDPRGKHQRDRAAADARDRHACRD